MIAYASRTSGKTVDALRDAGWGLLITPGSSVKRPAPGMPYVLDNGAWSAHTLGIPWDADAFRELVKEWGAGADWVAAPDIVCGGMASLKRSLSWMPWLLPRCRRVVIPVQDGMKADDLAPHVGADVGIFVGGSTEWKESSTLAEWGPLSSSTGCWLHVARVNSVRRIAICKDAGAHSIDGSSVSRFRKTLPKLDAAVRHGHLFAGWPA